MILFKKFYLILSILTIGIFTCCSSELKGQNLFFLGEKSYPCTETFRLNSKSSPLFKSDLMVLIAKDDNRGLLVLSRRTRVKMLIQGKVLVYLDDGTVIKCIERNINDYVNDKARSVYYLTKSEINKLKKSNINKIRYSMTSKINSEPSSGNSYTGSNKPVKKYNSIDPLEGTKTVREKTDVPQLVKELFEK